MCLHHVNIHNFLFFSLKSLCLQYRLPPISKSSPLPYPIHLSVSSLSPSSKHHPVAILVKPSSNTEQKSGNYYYTITVVCNTAHQPGSQSPLVFWCSAALVYLSILFYKCLIWFILQYVALCAFRKSPVDSLVMKSWYGLSRFPSIVWVREYCLHNHQKISQQMQCTRLYKTIIGCIFLSKYNMFKIESGRLSPDSAGISKFSSLYLNLIMKSTLKT